MTRQINGIQDFLHLLQGVKPKGRDQWMACCPAHQDSDPSMSIALTPDGKILLRCWAGCSALDVVASMNLSLSDLFPNQDYSRPMAFAERERRQREQTVARIDQERLVIALAESDRRAGKRLSRADMEREQQAFHYLSTHNAETDPDIVLLSVSHLLDQGDQ